jgi:sec-independent protein translocase protein TatC
MPFLDHLEEMRWRIIYAVAAILIGVGLGLFIVLHYPLVRILAGPVLPLIPEHKLVFTHPNEGLMINLNAAMIFGMLVASPVVFYQAWAFLAPALKKQEKWVGLSVMVAGVLLFSAGAALAFFVVMPISLPWLFSFANDALVPLITAEDYFSFLFEMVLTFGISFELPIVVLALTALDIVTPAFLAKYRRHAIVLIVFVGAFLTPGDAVSTTIALSVPLYALYELSVAAARVMYKSKQKRRAAREADALADAMPAQ